MPIVRLTDDELDAIMSAARPLEASRRDAFLQHVASSRSTAANLVRASFTASSRKYSVNASILRTSRARATRIVSGWEKWREGVVFSHTCEGRTLVSSFDPLTGFVGSRQRFVR
jgi:hypothetical protein